MQIVPVINILNAVRKYPPPVFSPFTKTLQEVLVLTFVMTHDDLSTQKPNETFNVSQNNKSFKSKT